MSDARPSVELRETPDGRRLVVSLVVDAPAEAAWNLLTDTRRWPEWGPSVRAVSTDGGEPVVREGTTGTVTTPFGVRVPFEVTACADYRWTWRVARIPATGHVVEDLGVGRCRVAFEVPVLAAGYVPVCRRALDRIGRLLA